MKRIIYATLSAFAAIGTVFMTAKAEVFSPEATVSKSNEAIANSDKSAAAALPKLTRDNSLNKTFDQLLSADINSAGVLGKELSKTSVIPPTSNIFNVKPAGTIVAPNTPGLVPGPALSPVLGGETNLETNLEADLEAVESDAVMGAEPTAEEAWVIEAQAPTGGDAADEMMPPATVPPATMPPANEPMPMDMPVDVEAEDLAPADDTGVEEEIAPEGLMSPAEELAPEGDIIPNEGNIVPEGQLAPAVPATPSGPGLGEPGLGQPGLGQPGLGQPGLGQPGLGQPGLGEPGLGEPGLNQPTLDEPVLDEPTPITPGTPPEESITPVPNEFPMSNTGDSLVGEGFTPFQLSYLALAGGLEEEGIPGGPILVSAYEAGDISAEDIVEAGAMSNRLGTAASDEDDYTAGVDRFLTIFRKDARSSN